MIKKECLQCFEPFEAKDSRKKFCTQSCAATFNNLQRGFRTGARYCQNVVCSKRLPHTNDKFCSHKCVHEFKNTIRVENWLSGKSPNASGKTGFLLKWARDFLLKEVGNKCSRCGWCEPNPILGYPILTVDHIDGNWSNNRRENLQVLCYNCHTLTSTFNALNVGNTGNDLKRPGSGDRYSLHRTRREKE